MHRWRSLPPDWPFRQPERFAAVDGSGVALPPGWIESAGAWGCWQSHVRLWQEAVAAGLESILIFEDDAAFEFTWFATKAVEFLATVPDDWDQIYLGGQHLTIDGSPPPEEVNALVLRGKNVNRTHAYAIRRRMMASAVREIGEPPPVGTPAKFYHVDYRLGTMHRSGQWNVYTPRRWLVAQAAGPSDVILNRNMRPRWWNEFPVKMKELPPC